MPTSDWVLPVNDSKTWQQLTKLIAQNNWPCSSALKPEAKYRRPEGVYWNAEQNKLWLCYVDREDTTITLAELAEKMQDAPAAVPVINPFDKKFHLAFEAYRRYGAVTDFKSFTGAPMPEFHVLPDTQLNAWKAALQLPVVDLIEAFDALTSEEKALVKQHVVQATI